MVDAPTLTKLIEHELTLVRDERVVKHVRTLLVPPYVEERGWDYGEPGQTFPCWIVLDDRAGSDTDIAYCEFGFGPKRPWGLLCADNSGGRGTIGMDSGWFATFMDAVFESFPATALPIWRVFLRTGEWLGLPLTHEMAWDEAWAACKAARTSDPASNYVVHHTIPYGAATGSKGDEP